MPCSVPGDRGKVWCRSMKAISSHKLYDQVFERIKDMIRSGELRQGSLLPGENRLAELMGVSRVTVRQALKQLSEAGIIETRKGKGSVVILDWKGLLEQGELRDQAEEYQNTFRMSTQARRFIEPVIARQAALHATEEDIARMEAALNAREDELVFAPLTGRTSALVDFHTAIWMSLHNPVLMETWEHLAETSATTSRLPFVPPVHRERQKEEAKRQHLDIFEAIRRRDDEYAHFYMLVHCDWIAETYGQYFEDFLK